MMVVRIKDNRNIDIATQGQVLEKTWVELQFNLIVR